MADAPEDGVLAADLWELVDGAQPALSFSRSLPATNQLVTVLALVHVFSGFALWNGTGAGTWDAWLAVRDTRDILRVGGQYEPLVTNGHLWRLVTSGVLHVGAVHLFVNGVALWFAGRIVEPLLGPARLVAVFTLATVAGGLTSHLVGAAYSQGASGGVFGLLGAAVLLGWTWPLPDRDAVVLKWGIFAVVMLNIGLSLAIPMWDAAAHTGGAVTGMLVAAVMPPRGVRWVWWIVPAVASVVALAGWWGVL